MTEEALNSSPKCDLKVILLGSKNVGKTSLFYHIKGTKMSNTTPPMLTNFTREIQYNGEKMKMMLHDTESGMSYHDRSLTHGYYRDSIAALIVYSADDIYSANKLPNIIHQMKKEEPQAKLILVRNKCDLQDTTVSEEEVANKLKKSGYDDCFSKTFHTSATNGDGIVELLSEIGKVLFEAKVPERKTSFKVYQHQKPSMTTKPENEGSLGCC